MRGVLGQPKRIEIVNLMRKAGYISLGRGKDDSEFSFIRPLEKNGYPRFHLFVRFDQGKEALFDLHLDQRRPVYVGSKAHGAEYDGPLLNDEIERIRTLIQ